VLRQTKDILARTGHRYRLLAPWYDVDLPRDIEKLREEIGFLKRTQPDLVPRRTAEALPDLEASEFSLGPEFD
jgi:hypothetical protein